MRELPSGYAPLVSINGTGIPVSFTADRATGINLNGTFINGKFSKGAFYNGDEIVRDLYAAEYNGTVGIYDFVTGSFITGSFTSNGYKGTTITYLSYIFTDANHDIDSASGSMRQAMIMDTLEADSFDFTARYKPELLSGQTIDDVLDPFENFEYATPISLYQDGELISVFYLDNIAPVKYLQDGSIQFKFSTLSFVGLLTRQNHNGGIYTAAVCKDVIAEILQATYLRTVSNVLYYECPNGTTYTIDQAVANTRIDGHLPATNVVLNGESRSARDNLRDVLFVVGASILKNADGSVRFTFNQPTQPTEITSDRIYLGDQYATSERVTKVGVVEHAYYQINSTPEEVLYDTKSDYVDHIKVIFDEPSFGFRATGLTINQSGPNFAIITGNGILYGKPYTHTQQQIVEDTGLNGAENVKTADNGLINLLNYINVLKRVKAYYTQAREVNASFVVPSNVKTGSLIKFEDPLNRVKTGLISKLDFVISGITKGNSTIITNWSPTEVGNNYEYCDVLTGSGTWNRSQKEQQIGRAITECRIVLIGGGDGGGNGANGSNGSGRNGGNGGAGGNGGSGGKVYQIDLAQAPASFSYSAGVGGNAGQAGGNSTVSGGIIGSSASGEIPIAGVINFINQDLYALNGSSGIAGGKGGNGSNGSGSDASQGESVGNFDGGSTISRYSTSYNNLYPLREVRSDGNIYSRTIYGFSGGGGGASANGKGGNASSLSSSSIVHYRDLNNVNGTTCVTSCGPIGSDGGNGANGGAGTNASGIGCGGGGGNGGGGGGGSGVSSGAYYSTHPDFRPSSTSRYINYDGDAGTGGTGGAGGKGGDGAVLIYY